MRQMQVRVQVGESRPSASAATVFGALMDNKKSKRAVQNAIFNSGARKHYRKKTIWLCSDPDCVKQGKAAAASASGDMPLWMAIPLIGIVVIAIAVLSSDGSGSTGKKDSSALEAVAPAEAEQVSLSPTMLAEIAAPTLTEMEPTSEIAILPVELELLEVEFRGADQRSRALIQTRLKQLGYYQGVIDGQYGQGTRSALAEAVLAFKENGDSEALERPDQVRGFFDLLVLDRLHEPG